MADELEWMLSEDGCLCINESISSVAYHPTLNVILIITKESSVKVLDVYSGVLLQSCPLSASTKSQVRCVYIPVHDKLLFTDGRSVGLRRDHNGILLLDTILQPRVTSPSDVVRIELMLSEAIHLLKSLDRMDVLNCEQTMEVCRELETKVAQKEAESSLNHKVAKWSTVCLELPHNVLKSVCSALVQEYRRLNRFVPSLSIASAIGERLTFLLPAPDPVTSPASGVATVDRSVMFSEAARRETFGKWPHMNYKWALPDQMAQAGFYHQSNSTGDDRAMCFTCNICLVCWEPTDEPWSEHERHSPSCPFVKGEYTQNVPLSVIQASGPALPHSDRIETFSCVGPSSYVDLIATATEYGNIVVWNVCRILKVEYQFSIEPRDKRIRLAVEARERRLREANRQQLQSGAKPDQVTAVSERNRTYGCDVENGCLSDRSSYVNENPSLDRFYNSFDPPRVSALAVIAPFDGDRVVMESTSKCGRLPDVGKPPMLVVGCSIRGTAHGCSRAGTRSVVVVDNPLVQAKNDVNQAGSGLCSLDIMSLEDEAQKEAIAAPDSGGAALLPSLSSRCTSPGLFLVVYSLGGRRQPCAGVGSGAAEGSAWRPSGTRQENGGCLFDWSLDPFFDDDILDVYGLNPFVAPPPPPPSSLPIANDFNIVSDVTSPMHPAGEENGVLDFADNVGGTIDSLTMRTSKSENKDVLPVAQVLRCIEVAGDCNGDTHRVSHLLPTPDGRFLLVAIGWSENAEGRSQDSASVGYLLLYRLVSALDYTTLGETPILTRVLQTPFPSIVILPVEIGEERSDSSMRTKNAKPLESCSPSGHAAVVTARGSIEIVALASLETIAKMEPAPGDAFVALTYCRSMDRLCASTLNGQLLLLQLCPKVAASKELLIGNSLCGGGGLLDCAVNGSQVAKSGGRMDRDAAHLLADSPLTVDVLTMLHELTQFTNLMPRCTATLPSCWTEIQQEQKQRRHPQHLQQQGEGQQHTRSFRLQCDSSTWDEHLLEITLPRKCCVGHVDLKFNLHHTFTSPPNIQVTLLKQNTCGIGRTQERASSSLSDSVDASVDFGVGLTPGSAATTIMGRPENPVMLPEFLEAHNAEILCGPLPLASCVDLSGQSGIVSFTSPELLKSGARTFLIHMKSLDRCERDSNDRDDTSAAVRSQPVPQLSKPPLGRQVMIKVKDKHCPVPSLQSLLEFYIPPPNTAEIINNATSGCKMDVPIGCNMINEISITVRTSKKCIDVPNEREQRVAMLESVSLQKRLLLFACSTDAAFAGVSLEHTQNLVFDILNWVACIQCNGASFRKDIKQSVFPIIQSNLGALINSCFLSGGRSIAHKASKLLIVCTEFYKSISDTSFEAGLLRALLDALPAMVSCQSAGAMRWFFLLLNNVKFLDTDLVGRQCFSLLIFVVEELNRRSNPMHSLLRARFGLYRNPFEMELFEIEAPQPPKPTSTPVTYASVVSNGASNAGAANNAAAVGGNNNNNGNPAGGHVGGIAVGNSSGGGAGLGIEGSSGAAAAAAIAAGGPIGGSCPSTVLVNAGGTSSLSEDGHGMLASFSHPAHHLHGLLEVEPLHFVCHSASDGTKVEKIDSDNSSGPPQSQQPSVPGNIAIYVPSAVGASVPACDVSHLSGVLKDIKKTEAELLKVLQQKPTSIVLQKANMPFMEGAAVHLAQKTTPVTGNMPASTTAPEASGPCKTPSQLPNSSGLPVSSSTYQHFLHSPPQQALVIERMHSGARRFVVLDFGKPVVLTDLLIPSCPDLVSLSIDLWTRGEEEDGQRLVVSTDIYFRALVMSDLLPPPVCRYLKVTAIGRYGMSTTRCRIPLGIFYGLTTIPPWVSSEGDGSVSSGNDDSKTQLNVLLSFLEDIHCRYSLASDRLRSLLVPLLSSNRSAAGHVQAFVRRERGGASGDENRVYAVYHDCVQLQQQFNLVASAAKRLRRWQSLPPVSPSSDSPPLMSATDPSHACTDKLSMLSESLLLALLGMTCHQSSASFSPAAVARSLDSFQFALDERTCELLFRHLATVGSRRFQAMANALLVRTCGLQPWWGSFIAKMLVELYSSDQRVIFPQDRVFLLLVSRPDKNLLRNTMPSILELLKKLLEPVMDTGDRSFGGLDLPLIGWVLLFVSFYLDLAEGTTLHAVTSDEAADTSTKSSKGREAGCSSRWDFIQEEWALLRNQSNQSKLTSSRYSRRKLQKRLLYHKQQLEDLEQTKKVYMPSAAYSMLKNHFGTKVAMDLNTAIKQQEQLFKKMLKHHTAKHFKDVVQMRRMEEANLSHSAACDDSVASTSSGPVADQEESPEIRSQPFLLHRTQSLKVARGLASLLLCMDYTCNVDMFLLACKILARVVTLARPAIGLAEILSQSELQRLLRRNIGHHGTTETSSWGGPWACHAITCLLQDILEGERMYPIVKRSDRENVPMSQSVTSAQVLPTSVQQNHTTLNNISPKMEIDDGPSQFGGDGNLVGLEKLLEVESDETSSDETPVDCNDASTKYTQIKKDYSDVNKTLIVRNDGSSVAQVLKEGFVVVPCGANSTKLPVSSVSSAIDSRLEMGVDIGAELWLRTMAFFESDAFFSALLLPLLPPADQASSPQAPTMSESFQSFSSGSPFASASVSSSADMLSICLDHLFCRSKMPGISLESLLQLWVTLNDETASDGASQVLPLSANAATGLLEALAWYPTLSLRTWYLAFKVLLPPSISQTSSSDACCGHPFELLTKTLASTDVLLSVLVKFLSGIGLEYSSGSRLNVGPNVLGAMNDFLVRLMRNCHSVSMGLRADIHLKEQLLRIVYMLVSSSGAVRCGQGPLDAQCRFINLLLTIHFEGVDLHLQTSIVETIASLVHFHVRASRQVTCRSSTESTVSDGTCFGGLFSVPLRNDLAGCTMEGTRSNLIHSLLSLCVRLVQTQCGPSLVSNPSSVSDTFKMERTSHMPSSVRMSAAAPLQTPQTDELKSSFQQPSACGHTNAVAPNPKCQYVADAVLLHQPTMTWLLSTLEACTGSTMAMLLGPVGVNSSSFQQDGVDRFVLGEPASVGDVVFQLLGTLNCKASNISNVLRPVLAFLSCDQIEVDGQSMAVVSLSEPLLWMLVKILDCKYSLVEFLSLGGIEVLCRNLVSSYTAQVNCHPSLLSIIMQKVNRLMAPSGKGQWSNADNPDGLVNFAPLGTITSKDPNTIQPADTLIQPVPPHRRARTPAWSYHFYPEDSWVDLTITLPCAILLHEVHIQPHLTSLATCPSAVSLEVSSDLTSRPKPLCSPRPTSGLTFIRLQLSCPEVATVITVRLYRPRDSSNVGLSQIMLLGSSAFGEAVAQSRSLAVPTEENVAKSCVGWLRVLHHCLTHLSNTDILANMCEAAASVPSLLQTCCSLLATPAPELYATQIESVLLTLGRHCSHVGLQVIDILLYTSGSPFRQGSSCWLIEPAMGGWTSVDSIMDIIHSLCTMRDSNTLDRVRALLSWLYPTAQKGRHHPATEILPVADDHSAVPTQAFVHCVAVTLWSLCEAGLQLELQKMIDVQLFRTLYDWSFQLESTSNTKWAVDSVLTSMCHIHPEFFSLLLEWMGFVAVPPPATDEAPITDDSKKEINVSQAPHQSTVGCGNVFLESITPNSLAMLAAASQSAVAVGTLINSGLPATLAQTILDFCLHMGVTSQYSAGSGVSPTEHMTDSDKAERFSNPGCGVAVASGDIIASILNFFMEVCGEGKMRDWLGGAEGSIFWLPLVDLLCLPLSHLSGHSERTSTNGLTAQQRASIEVATIQFLSRCCWCHSDNQQLLAQVLCKVIGKEAAAHQGASSGVSSISGFARRLVLQLLLENEKILVCIKASSPLGGQLGSGCHWRHPRFGCGHRYRLIYASMQMTCGDLVRSVSCSSIASVTSTADAAESAEPPKIDLGTMGLDLANCLSIGAGVLAKVKRHKDVMSGIYTKGGGVGGALQGPSNRGPVGPPNPPSIAASAINALPLSSMVLMHELFPGQPLPKEMTLAQLLTALKEKGQLLCSPHIKLVLQAQNHAVGGSEPVSDPDWGPLSSFSAKGMMDHVGFPSILHVFASVGGLALMAQYLPILYPDVNRVPSVLSNGKNSMGCDEKLASLCDLGSNTDADWVKIEDQDNLFDDFPDFLPMGTSAPRPVHGGTSQFSPSMPIHSLAAFGLFLRLPGYAETLLRERHKALCLLRLALGVSDDGEGGDIFSSPVAASLPTLPFQVLQQLFDAMPLRTDDGLLLRRMALDVGAIHLLLACLSILSHQNVDAPLPGAQHEILLSAARLGIGSQESQAKSDDKSHLYWAKGTGFGTGSTAQSWDVEQAILRQKSEEEHVTCLLLVLASFINPGGCVPISFEVIASNSGDDDEAIVLDTGDDEHYGGGGGVRDVTGGQHPVLPFVLAELLAQSCLLSTISSYLRNDSVLDMARHVPLYRALLRLLRALAVCSQLVGLLLPHQNEKVDSTGSGNTSICSLLTKMKCCVDTYASRLRANNKSKGSTGRGEGVNGGGGNSNGSTGASRFSSKTREEEEESEGLALLIPDIQETACIVRLATERLMADTGCAAGAATDARVHDDGTEHVSCIGTDQRFQKSIEDRYIVVMRRLQFDTFEMIVEDDDGIRFTIPHHFESNMRAAGDHSHPSRARRLAQETVTLSTSLPLSYSSSVFVRCDQDRLDLMKVLITGPAETPYANGCFEFDVYFPPDYPNSPMLINLETTGHHTVRFNPNLYNDGKVCLSILNTWHGRPEEKWNSQTSSFLQVLVSIQSLILVQEPYFNEPGYERSRGTPSGLQSSREYDSNIRQATVKWAMLEQIRNPCPCFKEVITRHFWIKRAEIIQQCETWITEMEAQGRDRRTGRTVALNCQALKRHFALLKEELSRIKPPSELEDLACNVGWTKTTAALENSDATSTAPSEAGPSGAEAVVAEFAQLVDTIEDSDSASSSQENGVVPSHPGESFSDSNK